MREGISLPNCPKRIANDRVGGGREDGTFCRTSEFVQNVEVTAPWSCEVIYVQIAQTIVDNVAEPGEERHLVRVWFAPQGCIG